MYTNDLKASIQLLVLFKTTRFFRSKSNFGQWCVWLPVACIIYISVELHLLTTLVVIYDRHMFIVQAADLSTLVTFKFMVK